MPTGMALLEESMLAISFGKLDEYLCEGGTIGIIFNERGQVLDAGREQRLFTKTQRSALGVRDGGCRFPGCGKPPSWAEAHHVDYWVRDSGPTDIANGILLCDITTCSSTTRVGKSSEISEIVCKPMAEAAIG
jgi:hypothetical protein